MNNLFGLFPQHVARMDEDPYWELDLERELVEEGILEGPATDIFADIPPMTRHMEWSESMTFVYVLNPDEW